MDLKRTPETVRPKWPFVRAAALAFGLVALATGGYLWLLMPDNPAQTGGTDHSEIIYRYDPLLVHGDKRDSILTVLIPFDRTRFFLRNGEPMGFEYDLVQAFVAERNENRDGDGMELKVLFLPTPFSQLIPLLESGVGDMAAGGLTITDARRERVDFTEPYIDGVREVVVVSGHVEPPDDFAALAQTSIYLSAGSSYIEHAEALNRRLAAEGRTELDFIEADASLISEDLLEMVNVGIIEATVVDEHVARLWRKVLPNIVVTDLAIAEGNEIAWAVAKHDASDRAASLKRTLNGFIENTRKGTLLGNILFERYYQNTRFAANPLTSDGLEQLGHYRGLLQKYGDRYGFDWRLLAALVFQESRFDPKARSDRGAVGLMQVLPSTGKDMGFDDLGDPETNIHAGVKYLAFLRDNFFADGEIGAQARERLILAAYNAGPGRVAELRRLTVDMGRDRNRWFGHVERAAQRQIGDETVRYVANINKYRIAYGLSEAILAARKTVVQ